MPISREDAHRIASTFLTEQPELSHKRIEKVVSLEEIAGRRPAVYWVSNRQGDTFENCWIAYLELTPGVLRSSTIILISKADGHVVYCGSADDEG